MGHDFSTPLKTNEINPMKILVFNSWLFQKPLKSHQGIHKDFNGFFMAFSWLIHKKRILMTNESKIFTGFSWLNSQDFHSKLRGENPLIKP